MPLQPIQKGGQPVRLDASDGAGISQLTLTYVSNQSTLSVHIDIGVKHVIYLHDPDGYVIKLTAQVKGDGKALRIAYSNAEEYLIGGNAPATRR
ncbi:hypothetical protein [Paraburkholderia humisilvae]|uniref:Uncharacterized protein n=1 Tax=Paraburkholderia humisilvae TaxID=627669 RepID=A0A6J5ENW2_9BURK|nr:hypothetical protein [Paraburkholderia humisilvae]CAB3766916.1 hypothetical protein LMG29542_05471 [Paraburkholderia humisilvae]